MEAVGPAMNFPTTFCCNCGAIDCVKELQDTRVTRYFGIGGSETTFHLPVPVCAICRRTTRRRPSGFFAKLLVIFLASAGLLFTFLLLGSTSTWPVWLSLWFAKNMFWLSALLALVFTFVFYRIRRPRAPQTSFYQPVRIKVANLKFTDVTSGAANVAFMKLAFTNPEYLVAFRDANQDSMNAGLLEAVKA
jgi:hypothetical protein